MNLEKNNLNAFTELQKIHLLKLAVKDAKKAFRRAKNAVMDQRDVCANSLGNDLYHSIVDFFVKRDPDKDFFFADFLSDLAFHDIGWTIYDAYEGVKNQKVLIFPKEYGEDLMKVIADEFFLVYEEVDFETFKEECYYKEEIESNQNIEWVCYKITPEILLDLKVH